MISQRLVFILTLLSFFIEGQCQSFNRYYLPEIKKKIIEFKQYDLDGVYAVSQLFKGQPIDVIGFDRKLYKSYEQSTLCDVYRVPLNAANKRTERLQVYQPYLCVEARECRGHDVIALRDLPCSFYHNQGVCCLVQNITFYDKRFGHSLGKALHLAELPNFSANFIPTFMYENLKNVTVEKEQLETALENSKFHNDLKQLTLCGVHLVKPNTHLSFFCVPEERCGTTPDSPKNHNPKEEWKQFCTNVQWYTGSTTKMSQNPKCCHAADINGVYSEDWLAKWELPQVPLNIKYAPGVRSSYMCEHYSQFSCQDTYGVSATSFCAEPSNHQGKVAEREAPHKALLGIAAPFTLAFHCLGTLISRYYILSTWHCSTMRGVTTNLAYLGKPSHVATVDSFDERLYTISEIINVMDYWKNHPDVEAHQETRIYGGLALFRTSSKVFFNSFMRPACIFYNSRPRPKDGLFFGLDRYYTIYNESSVEAAFDLMKKIHVRISSVDESGPQQSQIELPKCSTTLRDLRRKLNHAFYGPSAVHFDESSNNSIELPHWDVFCGTHTDINPWTLEFVMPCRDDRGGALVTRLEFPPCSWLVHGVLLNYRDCVSETLPTFFNVSMFLEPIEDIVWPYPFIDFASPSVPCYDSPNDPNQSQFMWQSEF